MKIRAPSFTLSGSKAVPVFFGDILGVSGGEKENIFYLIPSIPFILPAPCLLPSSERSCVHTMHTQHCPPEISHRVTARLLQPQACRSNVPSMSADSVGSTEHKLGRQVIKVFTWWMKRGGEGSIISNRTSIFPLSHRTRGYFIIKMNAPCLQVRAALHERNHRYSTSFHQITEDEMNLETASQVN